MSEVHYPQPLNGNVMYTSPPRYNVNQARSPPRYPTNQPGNGAIYNSQQRPTYQNQNFGPFQPGSPTTAHINSTFSGNRVNMPPQTMTSPKNNRVRPELMVSPKNTNKVIQKLDRAFAEHSQKVADRSSVPIMANQSMEQYPDRNSLPLRRQLKSK